MPDSVEEIEQLRKQLFFLQRAADYVDQEMAAEEELPCWVKDRIAQAAMNMKVAVGYIQNRRSKKTKGSRG